MALNYDLNKIADFESLYDGDDENGYRLEPMFESIILLSMRTGIGSITEDNAADVYARLKLIEPHNGFVSAIDEDGNRVPMYLEPEHVQRLIGLTTNVSKKTEAQFLRDLKWELRDFRGEYERATEAVTA